MLAYSKLLHFWHGMGPICPTTEDHLAVQSQENRCLEAVLGFSSTVLIPFVLLVGGGNYSISESLLGGKGWGTVTVNRENMKCITEALLKCIFQLQMLTWALTFIVADSAVTLASNSWSSRKQTHSMGAELMSADENHCWESVQLTASALLFSAVARSPLAVASVLYPQRPKYTLALYSPPQ